MYYRRRVYRRPAVSRRRYPTRRVAFKRPVVRKYYKRRNPAKRIVKRRFKGIQPYQFSKVLNTSQEVRDASSSVEFFPIWTDQFRNSASDKFFGDNLSNYAQVMPLGFSVVFKDFSLAGVGLGTPLNAFAGNAALYTFLDSCNIYPNTSQMSYQNMRDLVGAKTLHLSSRRKSIKYTWYVPKSVRRFVPCSQFKSVWNATTNQLKDALETVFGIDNLMVPKYLYVTQDNYSTAVGVGSSKVSYTIEWRFYARFYGRIQDDDTTLPAASRQKRSFAYPEDPEPVSQPGLLDRDEPLELGLLRLNLDDKFPDITPN